MVPLDLCPHSKWGHHIDLTCENSAEMGTNKNLKSNMDKNNASAHDASRVAWVTVFGVIFASLCTGISGYYIANRNLDAAKIGYDTKLVEIGVGILKDDPRLKSWAIRIIEKHSMTLFTVDSRQQLEHSGKFYDTSSAATKANNNVPKFGYDGSYDYGSDSGISGSYDTGVYSSGVSAGWTDYTDSIDYQEKLKKKLEKAIDDYNQAIKELKENGQLH
jgi:hypothetical protein